jgi:DNA-binding transcriptional MerR regulator
MSRYLYIGEVAKELGRVQHTIRQWGRDKRLPKELMPSRDDNGWRYWTEEQVEKLKIWIVETDLRPGKGIIKRKD